MVAGDVAGALCWRTMVRVSLSYGAIEEQLVNEDAVLIVISQEF